MIADSGPTTSPRTTPTGEQFTIRRADATATVTELAASLRQFSIGGVDITEPYDDDAMPPFADGIVLVPWPNRVKDGRWDLDGAPQQLDITEVERGNAIHGLLRNTAYRATARSEESVTLSATVFPQHGYPFHLETSVTYTLVDCGLDVRHDLENHSSTAAPVAVGTHPFLTIGDVPSEQLTLTVPAATYIDVDARLNVLGTRPVDGTVHDLRGGRIVGDLKLDTAFGDLTTVDSVSAVLRAPDGREVRLLQDENHPWVQVFITPDFPKKGSTGYAIAIEPMTAPPNALNSGEGLKWLAPGESFSVGWGIRYTG